MALIEFKDKGFEKAVKSVLKITSDNMTTDDLLVIKGVLISVGKFSGFSIPWNGDSAAFSMVFPEIFFNVNESENGQWLEDLQYFSHIKSLHLYVPTNSLGVLEDFNKLKELYVANSENKDWSFLEILTSLRYLNLNKCNFSDLRPLKNLFIKQLEQYRNSKREKNKFIIFEGIRKISLINCGIKDVSPIEDCIFIDELDLSKNEISDINPLKGIKSLYYLTLNHNYIEDITPLGDIDVYLIDLSHNHIKDISPLMKHRNGTLSRLFLTNNKIEDFSPLKGIHLVRDDISQAMSNRELNNDLFDKVSGKYYGMVLCEKEDIIGQWSQGILQLTDLEDINLVFKENGTGYLHWFQISYETVDTFNWSINNGKITISGVIRYEFEDGELITKERSQLNLINIDVMKNRRKGIDGKRVKAIEFDLSPVTAEDYYFINAFGFLSSETGEFDFLTKF